LLEPVLDRNRVHDSGVPEQLELPDADTTAVLVNVPNSPNTNPETAVAAMRVIEMRITVARTGEIAFFLSNDDLKGIASSIREIGYSHCGV
jgi:hypothetical protein